MKRQQRMKKMGKVEETIDTYETLVEKHKNVIKEIESGERKLATMTSITQHGNDTDNQDSNVDALDSFMSNLKDQNFDKLDRKRCRVEIEKLKQEEKRLRRLVNFTKPPSLPEIKQPVFSITSGTSDSSLKKSSSSCVAPKTKKHSQDNFSDEKQHENDESLTSKIPKFEKDSDVHSSESSIDKNNYSFVKEKKAVIKLNQSKSKKTDKIDSEAEYSSTVWQPPVGQTGDGRTSLNDKYGY